MCAQCLEGYYEWGGSCLTCDPSVYYPALMGLLVLIWIYVLVIHHLTNPTVTTGDAGVKCFMFYISTFRLMAGGEVRWLSWLSIFDFEAEQASQGNLCFLPLDPTDKFLFQVMVPIVGLGLLLLSAALHWCGVRLYNRVTTAPTPIRPARPVPANSARVAPLRASTSASAVGGSGNFSMSSLKATLRR